MSDRPSRRSDSPHLDPSRWSGLAEQRLGDELAEHQRQLAEIGKALAQQYRGLFENLAAGMQQLVPRFDILAHQIGRSSAFEELAAALKEQLSQLELPALQLDYASLFPDLTAISEQAIDAFRPALEIITRVQRDQFADLITTARLALRPMLPPNWRDDSIGFPDHLEQLVLDEGLPLGWVPPTSILARVLAAKTAQQRRMVLGRAWRTIGRACLAELDLIAPGRTDEHVMLAKKAAHSLLDGPHEASQALSTNLLDSILRASFTDSERTAVTGHKNRLQMKDHPIRTAIVLGAIWSAHARYRTEKGDKVPWRFSRHASVHGASSRQYTRINAVIALMHVTALLRLLETDFADR